MALFQKLTTLPADTEDLPEIIDKAGDFLIDQDDHVNAGQVVKCTPPLRVRIPKSLGTMSAWGIAPQKAGGWRRLSRITGALSSWNRITICT
jgi:hypothetical protein